MAIRECSQFWTNGRQTLPWGLLPTGPSTDKHRRRYPEQAPTSLDRTVRITASAVYNPAANTLENQKWRLPCAEVNPSREV
jgi:hypothetical protein